MSDPVHKPHYLNPGEKGSHFMPLHHHYIHNLSQNRPSTSSTAERQDKTKFDSTVDQQDKTKHDPTADRQDKTKQDSTVDRQRQDKTRLNSG